MDIICLICHERVRIPVQITCFPCHQEPPSCHDISRVCMLCARRYLQLDKPNVLRSPRVRCLTCDAVTSPPSLNSSTCYRKDYLLMSLDTETYSCPNCNYHGSQTELDRHVEHMCDYRIVRCPASGGDGRCGVSYRACDERTHMSECYFYVFCWECVDYIHKDAYFFHMHTHHRK